MRLKQPAKAVSAVGPFVGALALTSAMSATIVDYGYNDKGQLSTATYDDGTTVTYKYDENGNRTSVVSTGNWGSDTQPPTTPASTSATGVSTTRIDVTWSASIDGGGSGLAGYKLERCQGAGCTAFQQIADRSAAGYSDTGLTPNTTFRYRVRAYDNAGNLSTYSSIATAGTLADNSPPSAPGTPTISDVTGSSAIASWSGASDDVGVTAYEYSLNSTTWTSNGAATRVSLTGLSAATAYTFRVRARDAAGNIGNIASNSFTTPDSVAPGAPGTPIASNITFTSATVSWSPASDNVGVTSYEYRRGTSGGFTNVGTATSVNLTGLTAATSYTVQVQARDAAGNTSGISQGTFITTSPTITLPASDTGTATGSRGLSVTAKYTLTSAGDIFRPVSGNNYADAGDWLSPKVGMGSFSVRVLETTSCTGPLNTWLPLNLPREWTVTASSPNSSSGAMSQCSMTLQIRNDATGQIVQGSVRLVAFIP